MKIHRHLPRLFTRGLAATAVLFAAALPAAVAEAAGSDSISSVSFSPSPGTTNGSYFGSGASGTFVISGTFAGDGGNATVTSTATELAFSSVTDTTAGPTTTIQGNFTSTSSTQQGSYNLSITDDNGSASLTNAFSVDAAPAVTSFSPTTIADSATPSPTATSITGTGFVGTPSVIFTSSVNGTKLTDSVSATGGTILSPATSIPLTVTPTNSVTNAAATIGNYTLTVVNPDGGTTAAGASFAVTGNQISALSPSALTVPVSGTSTSTVTINGSGFEAGATASLGTCPGVTFVANSTSVAGDSSATFQVSVAAGTTPVQCGVTVTNTAPGNGASSVAVNGLGIGEASALSPVITSSSLSGSPGLVAGAPSSAIVFTGEGFSPYTTPLAYSEYGTANTHDAHATISGCVASGGTSLTCSVAAASNTVAGAHTALLENATASASLSNAFSVAGPTITSASPSGLAAGAPIGTTVALTGTGFTNTLLGTVGSGPLAGNFDYVSPTLVNFIVTTSPSIADASDTLSVYEVNTYGATTYSAPVTLSVGAAPSISSVTYPTGTSGVGVGATSRAVTINGTGLTAGATVTNFVSIGNVADTHVSATVTSVNTAGTQATLSVSVTAGDTSAIDGYVLTNTNGGTVTVIPLAPAGLVLDAAPTITAVSPATPPAASTNTFVVTGSGFVTGAVASLTATGTCAPTTWMSATSLSVVCTLGTSSSSPDALVVTNPDGGSATSAAILAAKSVTPPPATFKVSHVVGIAVHGRTMRLAVVGSGFVGAPTVTANASGVIVRDVSDNGTVLRILVTTPKNLRGVHTFTLRLKNGKTARVNYRTI